MILGYPVASVMRYKGADFMFQILTGKEDYTDEDIALFDLPSKITKDAPPVFMFATAEDLLTPYGVLAVANKCKKKQPDEQGKEKFITFGVKIQIKDS